MTDNDYRIEDRFEKGRPNYTLRRVKFAAAVVGLVVSVTLMLTWHGGGLTGALVVEGVYLATALWLLPAQPWISSLAVGLLFAITAIPVLYLYLRHIHYPPAATRRLVQSAILIDLTCWSLFGLAQGSLDFNSLLLPIAAALLPLLLRALQIRQPLCYSLSFFALLVVAEHYRLNALIDRKSVV